MSLYSYKIVEAVVACGSFKKASEALNLSASAVSHAIANLESELGFSLFRRTRSGIYLTEEGKRLLPHIREVSRSTRDLDQEIERINHHEVGLVRVGSFYSVAFRWLPLMLKEFHEKHPDIDVQIMENGYAACLAGIDDNSLDLAFTTDTAARGRNFTPLMVDPLLCLTQENYEPPHGSYVTPDDIRSNTLIMQHDGDEYDALSFMRENGLTGSTDFRISENLTLVSLVEKGIGVCIMPRFVAETAHCRVKMWPIRPNVTRTIGLTAADPHTVSPAVRLFRREIMDFTDRWLSDHPDCRPLG